MIAISLIKFVGFTLFCLMVWSLLTAEAVCNPIGSSVPMTPGHVYYSDPIKGSMKGDGSKLRPWGPLSDIVAAKLINGQDKTSGVVHAGDIIYLLSGNHGSISLDQYSGYFVNTDFITLQAAPGSAPVLSQLVASGISKWVFRGLTIAHTAVPAGNRGYFLSRFIGCDNILFDSNTIYSQADVSKWKPSDWASLSAVSGLAFDGTSSTIINNTVRNVEAGIGISGDGLILKNNVVDYFADDGINFTSSNSIIQSNTVTNHYGLWNNGGHHDGMQGWTIGGVVTSNVIIDSNVIVASTGVYPTIPVQPTGGADDYLQGLSIFDGTWTNLTLTNNVVAARGAYHGLSMYGISDSIIANNTVVNQPGVESGIVWLGVFNNRVSGAAPVNVVVRNNIANSFVLAPTGVVDDHNIALTSSNGWSGVASETVVSNPRKVFVNYPASNGAYDFRLVKGSPAIGAGSAADAPKYDVVGKLRNANKIDIGAFSY